jgi:UDP-2,3-diacylglucosamine pyrophosphatase LpxH
MHINSAGMLVRNYFIVFGGKPMKYRACFISDLHLGCMKAEVKLINKFLKENEFDTLYLVGDIIDIWRIKQKGFLRDKDAQNHINVIQKLLKHAKKGTEIHYIYGNHDEFIAKFISENNEFGNIKFHEKIIHRTKNNKTFIVIHGHQFDLITMTNPWLSKIGDHGYELLIVINKIYNKIRSFFGLQYWSLSKYIKGKIKQAANYISNFSDSVSKYAADNECDGIICGHIHIAEIKDLNNRLYANCGCWTDKSNCTAIVENSEGNLELLFFGQKNLEE